tara:strand:- start:10764 stop:11606 length:843 start_codon:yes stop_codon:yes gene_type:complete
MSKKVPKVLKVNDALETNKYKPVHENLPQPQFLCLCIGSVRSGKTNYLINALRNSDDFYGDDFWDYYKIISNTINNDTKGKYFKDAFHDVEDHYTDAMIQELIASQKKYDREDMPTMCILLDDILSRDFKKTNDISFLCSKFRHYEMSIFLTTQSFRSVSTIIRNNATNVLIFRQNNQKELEKIKEEYSELCGSEERFMEYYNLAHDRPYSFLYIDGQSNPAKFYRRHETLLGVGNNKVVQETPKQMEGDIFSQAKVKEEKELKMDKPKKDDEVDGLYFG